MSTQKRKFELYSRLQALGFTYDEAHALRRIEMTLHRWAESECNGEIERNEETGKPERVSRAYINGHSNKRHAWPCADREAGALRRLKAIMSNHPSLWFYHQGDPRGCALYVGRNRDLEAPYNCIVRRAEELGMTCTKCDNPEPTKAPWYLLPGSLEKFDTPEACARRFLREKGERIPSRNLPIDQYYTRGLAVCA